MQSMDGSRVPEEKALLEQARKAANTVRDLSSQRRDQAIKFLLEQFRDRIDDVLEANTLDLETSRDLALPNILLNWLKLTPDRLQKVITILEQLLDPLCLDLSGSAASRESRLVHYSPMGLVGFIYEALPELALILAGMCLKTGNALILRGGPETSHTNQAIADIIQAALEQAKLPAETIVALPANRRTTVEALVKEGSGLDLVIPYGRPTLVQQVRKLSEIPILLSSIGNCYLYWSHTGSVEQVQRMIIGSHRGHPEAVNAIDKVLIPANLQRPFLNLLLDNLEEEGFEIQGDQELCSDLPDLKPADPSLWSQPSLRKMVAFKLVDNLQQATRWMNTYSSAHANCIVSDSAKEIQLFLNEIKSATVFVNRSPEFSRLPGKLNASIAFGMAQYGGISSGVIDLLSLMKTQQIYQGVD